MRVKTLISFAMCLTMLCVGLSAHAGQNCIKDNSVYPNATRVVLNTTDSGLDLLDRVAPVFNEAIEQLFFVSSSGHIPHFDWSEGQILLVLADLKLSPDVYTRFGSNDPKDFSIHLRTAEVARSEDALSLVVRAKWTNRDPGFSVREALGFEVLHLAFEPTGNTVETDGFLGSEMICERRLVSAFETIEI